MSHENSPACELVATHCCICNRPLTDALSVELGIGPVCREKHGFDLRDSDPNFFSAAVEIENMRAIVPVKTFEKLDKALTAEDARTACNILIHWLAAMPEGDHVKPVVNAIMDLGFKSLAHVLRTRLPVYKEEREAAKKTVAAKPAKLPTIFIWAADPENTCLSLTTENLSDGQFQAFLNIMRKLPTRRWNSDLKINTVRTNDRRQLWTLLKTNLDLHGVTLTTHKGETILGQASN